MNQRLLLCLLTIFAFSTTSSQTTPSGSWYKCMTGKIGNEPSVMHLHRIDKKWKGFFYYNTRQEPLYFFDIDSTGKDSITLQVQTHGTSEWATIRCAIKGRSLRGYYIPAPEEGMNIPSVNISFDEVPSPSFILWDLLSYNRSIALFPEEKKSPKSTFHSSSVWPSAKNQNKAATFVTAFLRKDLEIKDTKTTFAQAKYNQSTAYFKEYQEIKKDIPKAELLNAASFNYEDISDKLILFESRRLLNLADMFFTYTGGAHGMYGTIVDVIDLQTGKVLTVKDILKEGSEKEFIKLLEKDLRLQYKIPAGQSLEEAGFLKNEITLSNNFYLTENHIGFIYTPYVLGPFSMGEIWLTVTREEAAPYLKKMSAAK
jgi:Protein of unknown function (DUF3298)